MICNGIIINIMYINLQKEEKQLELAQEALIQRVTELKNSIGSFIMKLEHEYESLSW